MRFWDVIVIGAGAAGLTAASAVASAGLSTLCVERGIPGGRLVKLGKLEDYPGSPVGAELAGLLLEDCLQAGAELATGDVRQLSPGPPWSVRTETERFTARAVIIAAGLSPGNLGIAGEQDFAGKGLSDCAECDGPLFVGRSVAVAGNSDWAIAEAIALAATAEHVWLVSERPASSASQRLDRFRTLPNVSLVAGRIEALSGNAAGLERIVVATPAGREELQAAGVFVYTNGRPCSDVLAGTLAADPDGAIPVDLRLRTSLPLLFAAGDVRSSAPALVLAALADGKQAGRSAVAALKQEVAGGSPCGS